MSQNEFRVRPVTRFILTHYQAGEQGASLRTLGEFQNVELAEQAGVALHLLLPGSTFSTVDGREAQYPSDLLQRAIDGMQRKYVIVAHGYDVETKAYYADTEAFAEELRKDAESIHGCPFLVFSRPKGNP